MPGVVEIEGQRVPATYANFYFVNGALLVPIYKHKANDKRCLRTLAEALDACGHKREVVGIDCSDLIWGLGAIHCLSQQQPRI
jgi:agmatine deiminase